MSFLEKDLESIIMNTSLDNLSDRGLYLEGKKYSQMNHGIYGRSDVILFDRPYYVKEKRLHIKPKITIVELKKDSISYSTLDQAIGYAKAVHKYIEENHSWIFGEYFDVDTLTHNWVNDMCDYIEVILIGKGVDTSSNFTYLADLFSNLKLYTYEYKYDGIHFKEETHYYKLP